MYFPDVSIAGQKLAHDMLNYSRARRTIQAGKRRVVLAGLKRGQEVEWMAETGIGKTIPVDCACSNSGDQEK
jgi:hypothetical protein